MDNVRVRTAEELERKYNLSKFGAALGNIETNKNEIIKVQNELINMLKALVINLGDTLQESVSLWFYEGVPTTLNKPYTDWLAPSDHYGDFYYDQLTGYVYKYTSNGWERQYDIALISAMALTNAELDVSLDHERKVYLSQPTPPYSSGDWWIQESGNLMICQVGKLSGDYEEDDFVLSTKYTTTIASKENDTITVLKGTVTQITEDYVKFTDLSTGGSSTIAGDNITTGNIKSANYVAGTSGTNINLTNGEITMPNVKLDNDGLKLKNGAKVIGNNGLMNTYVFELKNRENVIRSFLGWDWQYQGKATISTICAIPIGLEITSAKIHLYHSPVFWYGGIPDPPPLIGVGYARNIKAYKATNVASKKIDAVIMGEYDFDGNTTYSDMGLTWYDTNDVSKGASWTPTTPTISSYDMEEVISSDISAQFKSGGSTVPGSYEIKIETTDTADPNWTDDDYVMRTGWCYGQLIIEGYMTY